MIRWFSKLFQSVCDDSLFIIRVEHGQVREEKGRVSNRFLREIKDIVSRAGIQDGEIRGRNGGGCVRLLFSPNFEDAQQQQIRNMWILEEKDAVG